MDDAEKKAERKREAIARLHNHTDRDVYHPNCSACKIEKAEGK
jgi:hypothetical protein